MIKNISAFILKHPPQADLELRNVAMFQLSRARRTTQL
jgi:hypothetical protein